MNSVMEFDATLSRRLNCRWTSVIEEMRSRASRIVSQAAGSGRDIAELEASSAKEGGIP